jgi:hypothetical protein
MLNILDFSLLYHKLQLQNIFHVQIVKFILWSVK